MLFLEIQVDTRLIRVNTPHPHHPRSIRYLNYGGLIFRLDLAGVGHGLFALFQVQPFQDLAHMVFHGRLADR